MTRHDGPRPVGCWYARAGGLALMWAALAGSTARGQFVPAPSPQVLNASTPALGSAQGVVPPRVGISPGRYRFAIGTTSGVRSYVLHVPTDFDPGAPMPVVVALHGAGGNADSFLDETCWADRAEHCKFLAVAPEGSPLHPDLPAVPLANPKVWNSGQYGAHRSICGVDDVGFIVAVLDDVACRTWVDCQRVYAAGYSNGGAMAFRLAAERADRFAAVASVAGMNWLPAPLPCRSVPTMAVIGTLDPVLPLHGGLKVLPWEVAISPPVGQVMSRWAAANGFSPEPHPAGFSPAPGVRVEDYAPGAGGGVLRVMYVAFQGHAWPGGRGLRPERALGLDVSSLDATEQISEFFEAWSL